MDSSQEKRAVKSRGRSLKVSWVEPSTASSSAPPPASLHGGAPPHACRQARPPLLRRERERPCSLGGLQTLVALQHQKQADLEKEKKDLLACACDKADCRALH